MLCLTVFSSHHFKELSVVLEVKNTDFIEEFASLAT